MHKLISALSLVSLSTIAFAKNDPFVFCTGEMGRSLENIELEIITDRYDREGVLATIEKTNGEKSKYVSQVPTAKVIRAYERKAITLFMRSLDGSESVTKLTIVGHHGEWQGQKLNCQWYE